MIFIVKFAVIHILYLGKINVHIVAPLQKELRRPPERRTKGALLLLRCLFYMKRSQLFVLLLWNLNLHIVIIAVIDIISRYLFLIRILNPGVKVLRTKTMRRLCAKQYVWGFDHSREISHVIIGNLHLLVLNADEISHSPHNSWGGLVLFLIV